MEPTVEQVATILRASATPMRAVDIAAALTKAGTPANRESVNKLLYKGPFDKADAAGTPTWTLREARPSLHMDGFFCFEVDGAGEELGDGRLLGAADDTISRVLADLVALVPAGEKVTVHAENNAGGKTLAGLAQKLTPPVEVHLRAY